MAYFVNVLLGYTRIWETLKHVTLEPTDAFYRVTRAISTGIRISSMVYAVLGDHWLFTDRHKLIETT
jgi:hypothetical protein